MEDPLPIQCEADIRFHVQRLKTELAQTIRERDRWRENCQSLVLKVAELDEAANKLIEQMTGSTITVGQIERFLQRGLRDVRPPAVEDRSPAGSAVRDGEAAEHHAGAGPADSPAG